MHQEAADELVGIERHQLVSLGTFDAVVLLEGDAALAPIDKLTGCTVEWIAPIVWASQ